MIFSKKVLLSKANVMQEKSVRQNKRQNCGILRGLGFFFFRQKMGCSGANFRSIETFPSADLSLCQITSTKYAQTEKKRPLKKKSVIGLRLP